MEDYKYKGEPLTEKIARYILLKNYAGKGPVSLDALRKEVNNYHLSQGGKETEYRHQEPVQLALTRMKNNEELANNPKPATWEVYSKEDELRMNIEVVKSELQKGENTLGAGHELQHRGAVLDFEAQVRILLGKLKGNFHEAIRSIEEEEIQEQVAILNEQF